MRLALATVSVVTLAQQMDDKLQKYFIGITSARRVPTQRFGPGRKMLGVDPMRYRYLDTMAVEKAGPDWAGLGWAGQ